MDGDRERAEFDMRRELVDKGIVLSFSAASPLSLLLFNPTHSAPSDGMNSRSCLLLYTKTDCPSQGFVKSLQERVPPQVEQVVCKTFASPPRITRSCSLTSRKPCPFRVLEFIETPCGAVGIWI